MLIFRNGCRSEGAAGGGVRAHGLTHGDDGFGAGVRGLSRAERAIQDRPPQRRGPKRDQQPGCPRIREPCPGQRRQLTKGGRKALSEPAARTIRTLWTKWRDTTILDELARNSGDPPVSPELVEIIGVRLMLTNLLKPLTTGQKITPEVFDGIIAEVKKHKRSLAIKTRTDLEKD